MSTIPSPDYQYQVGGSLAANHPTYVVRHADQEFYDGLTAGEFCYVLNSRQMGKSSLRVRMMERLKKEGFSCAAIDLTTIGSENVTPLGWYMGIFFELVSEFGLLEKINRRRWWKERDELSPVQRLNEFIEDVLLQEIKGNIVIFIDEIDSVLSLDFSADDFFAFIRACYNLRVDKPEYKRLTFALLGVATPSDFIQDKRRTPFNIGRAIEPCGFKLEEVQPLAKGLEGKVSDPQAVLAEILKWTGGQPFLTQKLCNIVRSYDVNPDLREEEWIAKLVKKRILENWESQDNPEHLRTIRDRVLKDKKRVGRILGLYQDILKHGELEVDSSLGQKELQLSGLVIKKQNLLRVCTKIYEQVFNSAWTKNELSKLRPYADSFQAWFASNCQDTSRLLNGKALQEALEWSNDKSLSDRDYKFLVASQELETKLEKQNFEISLSIKDKENQIIAEANETLLNANETLLNAQKKARRRISIGTLVLFSSLSISAIASLYSWFPKRTLYYQSQCAINLSVGKLASAQEACQAGIDADPDNIIIRYQSGNVYEKLLDFEKAHAEYEIAVNGGFLPAYSQKARLYLLENDCDRAIPLLTKALKQLNDTQIEDDRLKYTLLKNLGWAKLSKWQRTKQKIHLQEAKKHLQKAIKINSIQSSARCLLAQVYEEEENKDFAISEWKKCINGLKMNTLEEFEWIKQARQYLKMEERIE
ncbi:AAA-like domain-containing protein [Lusitaniella coriacea]|uniref:AAA-like domain-containing protein n=1 Tax=Lusitaniella coriacea TaxID=1983105 RepID=UPI003CF56D14